MEEVIVAAKEETVTGFDAQADKHFAEADKVREESAASETEQTDAEDTQEDTGADQSKKASLKEEAEATDADKAIEEKLAKISEILGDDPKAIEAYIKQKGYHKDPAWQKLLSRAKAAQDVEVLPKEAQDKIARVDKVLSDPNFIRYEMKQQGYKDDAIDAKLRELGHKVEDKTDTLGIVINKLGIDMEKLDDNGKNYINTYIADVVKVADILIQERLAKALPETIRPLSEHVTAIVQRDSASKLTEAMKSTVAEEGILDFEKDIVPELDRFIDENPQATQFDIKRHFDLVNHSLAIERIRTGKKRASANDTKGSLRSQKESGRVLNPSEIKKTGKFDEDADAVLDALGVNS